MGSEVDGTHLSITPRCRYRRVSRFQTWPHRCRRQRPLQPGIHPAHRCAADNGFHGLGGNYARNGLLSFATEGEAFRFQRSGNGRQAALSYDPASIPPDPAMMPLMQQVLQGSTDGGIRQRFREL